MDKAHQAALNAVLTKRRTEKEVITHLTNKGFGSEEAQNAASYYKELGYIDHRDYARRYTSDAAKIKGQGPLRIRRALTERGVEEEFIEEALQNTAFSVLSLMEKRFGRLTAPDMRQKQKIINHFIYKGFAYDDIKKAVSELFEGGADFE